MANACSIHQGPFAGAKTFEPPCCINIELDRLKIGPLTSVSGPQFIATFERARMETRAVSYRV